MSVRTAEQACKRIAEHCRDIKKNEVEVILHGGEPLLVGSAHLEDLIVTIYRIINNSGLSVSLGMQSNGLLFSEEIGDLCLKYHITIGVSIDGPPHLNDQYRVDHRGHGTSATLERKLELLTSPRYRSIFAGFLVVVNPKSDPIETLEYLMQYSPSGIDFLLPYDNHDRYPPEKKSFEDTIYGDWLIRLFDYWFHSNLPVRIRLFDSILRLLFKGHSLSEAIGFGPVDLIVLESNGDVEAVDSLKATFDGATNLDFNVYENSLDEVINHTAVKSRRIGTRALCTTCQACEVVDICGGGYLPNRYSAENGFMNPSVYCKDLELLIRHIHAVVKGELHHVGCTT